MIQNNSNPRPAGRGGFGRGAPQGPGQVVPQRSIIKTKYGLESLLEVLFASTLTSEPGYYCVLTSAVRLRLSGAQMDKRIRGETGCKYHGLLFYQHPN